MVKNKETGFAWIDRSTFGCSGLRIRNQADFDFVPINAQTNAVNTGFYGKPLYESLEPEAGNERGKAGNREVGYDGYQRDDQDSP
mgnify:CR=1 FL=1